MFLSICKFRNLLTLLSDAFIATIIKQVIKKRPQNAFQLGIKHLSWAMIVVIIVVCPIVSSIPLKSIQVLLTTVGLGRKLEDNQ